MVIYFFSDEMKSYIGFNFAGCISFALYCIVGPLAASLTMRFGSRAVVMAGAFLSIPADSLEAPLHQI